MDINDITWDLFIKTGRVDAYLVHKNIIEAGLSSLSDGRCRESGKRDDKNPDCHSFETV